VESNTPKNTPSSSEAQPSESKTKFTRTQVGDTELYICSDNCYYWKWTIKGKIHYKRISNFIIEAECLLQHSSSPKRIMSIKNKYEESHLIVLPVKELVSPNDFSKTVEGKGNFVMNANREQFSAIREYIYETEKRVLEIEVLGWQPKEKVFAYANGIFDGNDFKPIDERGIVNGKESSYYIPAMSNLNELSGNNFAHDKKFIYKDSKTDFKAWSELFVKVYEGNGKVSTAFVIAAVFRDVIFNYLSFFPILHLFAIKGTGKTVFTESMLSLYGEPQESISLKSASTPKAFQRRIAQIKNGINVFEEYKNDVKDSILEFLKSAYDGMGYERAVMSNDNRTHSTAVNSSIITVGQEIPTKENALLSRMILLELIRKKRSDDAVKYFNDLKQLEDKGLGNVLNEILKCRPMIEGNFKATFNKIHYQLKSEHKDKNIEERSFKNMAAILAPVKIVEKVLSFPFSYDDLYSVMTSKLITQSALLEQTNEVNRFWSVLATMAQQGIISNEFHFLLEDKEIYIRYDMCYEKYREYNLKKKYDCVEKQSLLNYLLQQSYCIKPEPDKNGKARNTHQKSMLLTKKEVSQVKRQRRCHAFDLSELDLEFD